MYYGVNLFLWTAAYTDQQQELIPKVKSMGFDLVEIPLDLLNRIDVGETGTVLADNELQVAGCAVVGPNRDLISDDTQIRQEALQYFIDCVTMLGAWGGKVLCGPCYSAVGKLTGESRTAQEWKRAVESLREIGRVASDHGVAIAVEPLNRFETYFLNTASDTRELVEEVNSPAVGIHLDTFHMNIEEKSLYQAIHNAGEKLFHVHACENDRGTPGEGNVDWDGVFRALRETGYDRSLVIESFVPGVKEIARAASIWRPMAPDSDYIARQGLAFLKSRWP